MLKSLPDELTSLKKLKKMYRWFINILIKTQTIKTRINDIKNFIIYFIFHRHIQYNKFTTFPQCLFKLQQLEEMYIINKKL